MGCQRAYRLKELAMPSLTQDSTGNDLTYRIIGAAMAVHNALGAGYKEEVYERALHAELNARGIASQIQFPVDVWHAGEQVALFYLDLFVEGTVVVELKAFSHQLTNDEIAQVINYLKATGVPVGLLFNFGRRRLEYRRIYPPKSIHQPLQRLGRDDVRPKNAINEFQTNKRTDTPTDPPGDLSP
jgi:GxxExxY protein